MTHTIDVAVLTDRRYTTQKTGETYYENLWLEDRLVVEALERQGLRVIRVAWDDPTIHWEVVATVLFRTTWDYAERFEEFSNWLNTLPATTRCINSREVLDWNIDKRYLLDLEKKGIPIAPSAFVSKGEHPVLAELVAEKGWKKVVVKPIVGAGGVDTFAWDLAECATNESLWQDLLANREMMIQEFQEAIVTEGEWSFMLMGNKLTHAILKQAKSGEFRVQDDFGGSVVAWDITPEQRAFAEQLNSVLDPVPVYTRVDAFTDNQGRLAVGELELIEPELWFRFNPEAADELAIVVVERYFVR